MVCPPAALPTSVPESVGHGVREHLQQPVCQPRSLAEAAPGWISNKESWYDASYCCIKYYIVRIQCCDYIFYVADQSVYIKQDVHQGITTC